MKRSIYLLLALCVAACNSGGGTTNPKPTHKKAPGINGYSAPNSWHLIGLPLSKALCENGHSATEMEWTPYINSPPVCKGTTNATYPIQALAFVNANRSCGITTMISIANWNGCATTQLPDSWMQQQVDYIVNTIGSDHVILSPVSEPPVTDSKAKRWTQLARNSAWHGLFSLPDLHRSGPLWPGIPYDLIDVHYCKQADLQAGLNQKNPKFIRNTDCGTLVNPGPMASAQLARQAVDTGSNLLIYDFSNPNFDMATIVAMGNEYAK